MTALTFGLRNLEIMSDEKARGLERHIQSVLAAVAIAMMLWVGNTVQTTGTEVAVLKVQVRALEQKVDTAIANRFTADDGKRLERKILQLESQYFLLDDRIRKLEVK